MTGLAVAYVVLVSVGFLGGSTFIVMYASQKWYQTETGRILMGIIGVLTGLLGLSLLGLLVEIWPPLWLGGMASLDVVLWWLVTLLWRLRQRRPTQ